ncbi:uncharacterized protein K452DRAFT_22387 [Aplosporella prunicola CBS 121167]|uniref:Uncharacterized protein n=1 Tax=Aplosporella prunicola CBS 121167 TaxID=1176127 RepID=A0A6A6BGX7_9PEZI|nr:uncharacterized protein K452DRAFT_22387 [Aplosporella prunicola CBS 121167]KAF2142683.1 hypothetical protein K452DRAFT_22387 [Aplosporella prunicola CBS 121167]
MLWLLRVITRLHAMRPVYIVRIAVQGKKAARIPTCCNTDDNSSGLESIRLFVCRDAGCCVCGRPHDWIGSPPSSSGIAGRRISSSRRHACHGSRCCVPCTCARAASGAGFPLLARFLDRLTWLMDCGWRDGCAASDRGGGFASDCLGVRG